MTENKKKKCEQLYKRWKELEEKMPKATIGIPHRPYKVSCMSQDEREEFYNITEELWKKYLNFLSIGGRFDIEQRIAVVGHKKPN